MQLDIVIIGCGGTGSHYIKELGRFLYHNHFYDIDYRIVLIDGDLVEEKNLTRQAFIKEDIGYNKAKVMSKMLNEIYHVSVNYYDKFIDHMKDINKLIRKDALILLIGCVDNHQCRQSMHNLYETLENCIYMDSANEYKVGEIVIGSRIGGIEMYPDRTYYFPEVLSSNEPMRSMESCELLNKETPQHLITNQFAAQILLSQTIQLLCENKWLGGIFFFDSFKCSIIERTENMI